MKKAYDVRVKPEYDFGILMENIEKRHEQRKERIQQLPRWKKIFHGSLYWFTSPTWADRLFGI